MDVLKKYALFHIHTFTKYCCGSEPLLVLFFVCRIIIKSFQMSSERWRLWWQAYKVSPDCALSLSSAVPFSCFSSLFGRLHNLGLIKGALWKLVGDLASFFFFLLFTWFILLEVNVTFFLPHQQSMKPTKRLYVYHTLHPTQTAAKLWFTSAFIPQKHHLFNWHSSHFHVISEIQYSYATV